jgi:hypothetical protein
MGGHNNASLSTPLFGFPEHRQFHSEAASQENDPDKVIKLRL